jgi:predicted nucleic acid-binding protein
MDDGMRAASFSGVARHFCSTTRRLPTILAGARDEADYRSTTRTGWLFEDLQRVITPSHITWTRAALIVARLVQRRHVSPGGFSRSFLNDCLIAASAREHGFILVTRNTSDFALISQVERGIWYQTPWPE